MKSESQTQNRFYFLRKNQWNFRFRESFSENSPAGKVRNVSWHIEQVVDEIPLYLLRLEEFSHMLHERVDFGAFKFCFMVATTFIVSTPNILVLPVGGSRIPWSIPRWFWTTDHERFYI